MLITNNNIIQYDEYRILEIPFKGVDNKAIIKSVETCRQYLDPRSKDDRTFYMPGPPMDIPEDSTLRIVSQDDKGCTYVQPDNSGVTIGVDVFYDPPTTSLFQTVFNYITRMHNTITGEEIKAAYQKGWFFLSTKETEDASFHEHIGFKEEYPNKVSNYTWTYYVQVPDNCEGDEGKLAFAKDINGKDEMSIEVKTDTLYIFPANLYHRPNLSPNSTVDRITAAGNICIPHSKKCFLL